MPADPYLTDPDWAWTPFEPDVGRPWNLAWAGHLFRRAAFGAGWSQLQTALAEGPQRTIDALLRPDGNTTAFNRTFDKYEAASAGGSKSAGGLRAWWLRRMVETPQPLLENLTLFWHNHFAISNDRVKDALLMQRHLQLLRRHALGSFEALLQSVSTDPAVHLGLDSKANRKARPNRNFPRALFEHFALGAGHFSEEDIQEAARAFTGSFVLRNELRHIPREHDLGVKRFLGREGNLDAQQAVRITLEQPATARLIVRKLCRWLVSETDPFPDALVAPLAEGFARDYDIAGLVERILRSNLFFSQAAYRQKIKGPVEFALGIVKGLEGRVGTTRLGADLAELGQDLCRPPTIKGWVGSRYWINRFTLAGRTRLAQALVSSSGPYEGKLDPARVAADRGHRTRETVLRFLVDLFLQDDLDESTRQGLMNRDPSRGDDPFRQAAGMVVALPEFHLA